VIDAPVLVTLANAGRPRRPVGARRAVAEDPFAREESATRMLKPFLGRSVAAGELEGLRRLARAAGRIAASVADGTSPPLQGLNRLAGECTGRTQLRSTPDGRLEAVVRWEAGPAPAVLARRIVEELAGIEPGRLRRCARPECGLLFYDSTRSGTQRWHSEVPCGWRERQRRRRAQ
jgi:predicted RNA-binding Zn ribbon-like protein